MNGAGIAAAVLWKPTVTFRAAEVRRARACFRQERGGRGGGCMDEIRRGLVGIRRSIYASAALVVVRPLLMVKKMLFD